MRLLRKIGTWLAARRFAAAIRQHDQAIAAARAAHRPTKHLRKAKSDAVHAALAQRVWG
jgi:hypothetical protein